MGKRPALSEVTTTEAAKLTDAKHGCLDEVPPGDDALLALGEDDHAEEGGPEGHGDAEEGLQLHGHRLAEALLQGEGDLERSKSSLVSCFE